MDLYPDGKRAKIKHSTLIGKYEEGGIKDVDFQLKCYILQINFDQENGKQHEFSSLSSCCKHNFKRFWRY